LGLGTVSILVNTIFGFHTGILVVREGAPIIRRNLITGTHADMGFTGLGISVLGGLGAEITDNRINSPVISGNETGIRFSHANSEVSAALARNQVVGQFLSGIEVQDTNSFTLDSDLVAGTGTFGLTAIDTGITGSGDIVATNATIFDNGTADIQADNALVTL